MIFGDRGARLHRIADKAIVDEADARHMCRFAECGIGCSLIAERPIAAEIVGHIIEQRAVRRA